MRKPIFLCSVLLLLVSCGHSKAELTANQMSAIASGAGKLARFLAYTPDDERWSEPPDSSLISEMERLSARNPEIWPVFFRAAADTAMKLNQLEIQARSEASQSELL